METAEKLQMMGRVFEKLQTKQNTYSIQTVNGEILEYIRAESVSEVRRRRSSLFANVPTLKIVREFK